MTNADLDAARDKVLMGVERKSVAMSEHERVTCAYHEAGHAVVAALLPDADPLHKVTIIPRGRALGVTMQLPEADRYTHSKPFIEAQIAILMGGRVAEELFLRQMTSGASNDIERATELARKMVCELGMSPLGPVHFRRPANGFDNDNRAAGFSEETARRIDEEVKRIVSSAYEHALELLRANHDKMDKIAEALIEVLQAAGQLVGFDLPVGALAGGGVARQLGFGLDPFAMLVPFLTMATDRTR